MVPLFDERPICDVCNLPVEDMQVDKDIARCVRMYRFRCHGEEERSEVSDYEIAQATSVQIGRVFVRAKPGSALVNGHRYALRDVRVCLHAQKRKELKP